MQKEIDAIIKKQVISNICRFVLQIYAIFFESPNFFMKKVQKNAKIIILRMKIACFAQFLTRFLLRIVAFLHYYCLK